MNSFLWLGVVFTFDVSACVRGLCEKKPVQLWYEWHGRKVIICVAQCLAALVPVCRKSALIASGSCEKTYIGEAGRKFGTRFKEHKSEVEAATNKPFTRSQHLSSLSEQSKSALTDHTSHDDHRVNWPASTILDRESDGSTGKNRKKNWTSFFWQGSLVDVETSEVKDCDWCNFSYER